MKLLFLFFFSGIVFGRSQHIVSDLNWLSGHWEMIRGEKITEEHWLPESGNTMLGMSRTVNGNMTLEYEFIVLEKDADGNIYYRATPVRQNSASFKLTKYENMKAVFENSEHDFPQRIIYHRISDDSLIATVEGTVNGKIQNVHFPYRKKE